MRFEVIGQTFEQRVAESLRSGGDSARVHLDELATELSSRVNKTATIVSSEEFRDGVMGIFMPTSLPGFLLCLAVLLRVVYFLLLRRAACQSVARVRETLAKSE